MCHKINLNKSGCHHETDQQNHRPFQQHERFFRYVQPLIR
ncbi:hypothetical protein ENTCAN_08076 [Enterobacter cancerogenus ATCC 35316]|nr:hypothetical protein ENTCAN_08076 [Enterobacter cancerogenus ATCC 35316]